MSWAPPVLLLVLCGLAVGCGSQGEQLLPVEGAVVFDGQPLLTGVVSLRPTRGNTTWHQPTGAIDAQGRYRIYTSGEPGAPPGWYRVVVFATEPTVDTGKVSPGMPKSLIPARYNRPEATPLELEVKPAAQARAYDLRLERE